MNNDTGLDQTPTSTTLPVTHPAAREYHPWRVNFNNYESIPGYADWLESRLPMNWLFAQLHSEFPMIKDYKFVNEQVAVFYCDQLPSEALESIIVSELFEMNYRLGKNVAAESRFALHQVALDSARFYRPKLP